MNRKLNFERLLQNARAADRTGELCRTQRLAVPVPGRDIMVQALVPGRRSLFSTSPIRPIPGNRVFRSRPAGCQRVVTGGYWSAYWYNGHIYGSEIARGLDIFKLKPGEFLSQNEIDAAVLAQTNELNVQMQQKSVWPANVVVAKAYIDQLNRSKAISADRSRMIIDALGRAGKIRSGELDKLVGQLEHDASGASARDALRFKALEQIVRTKFQ